MLNWGDSKPQDIVRRCKVINHPDKVALATNKLKFFQSIETARVPEWTACTRVAGEWLRDDYTVMARSRLTGHSGEGIIILERGHNIPIVPLYTKYVKKKHEYRIHIMQDRVFYMQQKRKRTDVDEVDYRIRNHAGGFVYCNQNIDPPFDVTDQAQKAMRDIGLDFGAVDVIYNEHEGKAYVLEINTAPGLEGTTLVKYEEAIREYCKDNDIQVGRNVHVT